MIMDKYIALPREMQIYVDRAASLSGELVYGTIQFDPVARPDRVIIYFQDGSYPHLTIAHELGHAFDLAANRFPGRLAYRTAFEGWREALSRSAAYRELLELQERERSPNALGYYLYALSYEECWARCFSQFFAEAAPQSELAKEFQKYQAGDAHRLLVWETSEFVPIRKAMGDVFETLSLLKERPGFPDDAK